MYIQVYMHIAVTNEVLDRVTAVKGNYCTGALSGWELSGWKLSWCELSGLQLSGLQSPGYPHECT